MDKCFEYEMDLVKYFSNNYKKLENEIVIEEMPIRFGNIDLVSIGNVSLPFSPSQINALSKPANALVFMKIKNNRPISKKTILSDLGLSKSTIENTLYQLINEKLITKLERDKFVRTSEFVFPKTRITGYEAKLYDFNKAFYQAKGNKEYVDYSYLIFPLNIAERIAYKKEKILDTNGLGLVGVSKQNIIELIKPKKTNEIKNHIRLLSITKANVINRKSLAINEVT